MSRETRIIIISVITTLVVVVMLQNMTEVTLRFIMWHMSLSLALLIVFVFAAGFFAGRFWKR